MPKVTIITTDGRKHEVNATPEQEEFYDNLPFTSDTVAATVIHPDR
ncbi:hypothetical protein [Nonomuraea typhae]|uniref:Uncharacterized protein n=1 Tax=Nonomuraea typhae TaxID=2603600 RepID=A0ABW7YM17_9ACTN